MTDLSDSYIVLTSDYQLSETEILDWRYEVANGDTVLGLAEWIQHKHEADSA